MDDTHPTPRTDCEPGDCRAGRAPGHGMHRIQLGVVNGTPWAWRSGVVRSVAADVDGPTVVVHYPEHDVDVTLRHHRPLPLAPGDVVAVHEQGCTLELGAQWRSVVVVAGGLGPAAVPADPARWPRRRRGTPDSVAAYYPG